MSETLKTMDIKGKPYVLVNERIKAFRKKYAGWSLESEIVELTGERCVIKAIIKDDNGVIKATGTAYELANSTYINKTSYVENCETSAWGRALGNLGIGIDTSIASAEEVQNAVTNQEDVPFPEADDRVTAKDVQMIEGLFALEPDGGKILRTLLLGNKNIKKLTKREYAEFKQKYNKYKSDREYGKKRLDDGTKAFASKANLEYDAAKQMIQDSLEIDFNKVQPSELDDVLKKIANMIKDLSVSDE